ncbi:hypothetical protein IPG36_08200 [bacterium]|nr:MAG: hypothetical protein IPG36_08200 [bacterium]
MLTPAQKARLSDLVVTLQKPETQNLLLASLVGAMLRIAEGSQDARAALRGNDRYLRLSLDPQELPEKPDCHIWLQTALLPSSIRQAIRDVVPGDNQHLTGMRVLFWSDPTNGDLRYAIGYVFEGHLWLGQLLFFSDGSHCWRESWLKADVDVLTSGVFGETYVDISRVQLPDGGPYREIDAQHIVNSIPNIVELLLSATD